MRNRPKILSLFWHGIASEPMALGADSKDPSPDTFRRQIEFLLKHYTPISVWDFLNLTKNLDATCSFAKPPVLLGFDDGFRSVVIDALPILREHGVPAVFFVVGETIRNPDFVPWFVEMKHMIRKAKSRCLVLRGTSFNLESPEGRASARRLMLAAFRKCRTETERQHLMAELERATSVRRPVAAEVDEDLRFITEKDLGQLGTPPLLTIASHAMTHRYLEDLTYEEQLYELRQSDLLLRERCPNYCPVIAYPAGSFNATTVAIAHKIYQAGFAVFLKSSYRNRFAYPRIGFGNNSVEEVAYGLSPLRLNVLLPAKKWLCMSGLRKVGG